MSIENPRGLPHIAPPYGSRREFLARAGGGFGMVRSVGAVGTGGAARGIVRGQPARAEAAAIFRLRRSTSSTSLCMAGRAISIPSIPKPLLEKLNGQQLPESLRNVRLQFTDASEAPLLASQRKFARHGQSGIEVSDLFPNVARYVDDMAVIRSCHHEAFVHGMALEPDEHRIAAHRISEHGLLDRVRTGQ